MTATESAARIDRHRALAAHLCGLDDDSLLALLATSRMRRRSIGGETAQVDVQGVPVFVKRVDVTALERQPAHRSSTANVFGLPLYYHYGIGSVGFGVWREVAAHGAASAWVRSDARAPFALLHHGRVVPGGGDGAVDDREARAYLSHRAAIPGDDRVLRRRLDDLRASRAQVALFMEWVPATLSNWLSDRCRDGGASLPATLAWVEREAAAAFAFLRRQGFVHFDAHLDNVLTDGQRLCLGDLGLALHDAFDLDARERTFLARHADYDAARFGASLALVLCRALPGDDGWRDKLRRLQRDPAAAPPTVMAALQRHAPAALHMADFARRLTDIDRHTPFTAPPAATAT